MYTVAQEFYNMALAATWTFVVICEAFVAFLLISFMLRFYMVAVDYLKNLNSDTPKA